MKKITMIFFTLILVFLTTFIKNFTKKIDEEIYFTKENLSIKKESIEILQLEYDYLTTPSNLLEYQKTYFEEELIPVGIKNIGNLKILDQKIILKDFDITND